ncbi:MAG: RDD family protein [Actinobacteria bacterium]|nr:RDD family protein [Actinomycetota bacterium]
MTTEPTNSSTISKEPLASAGARLGSYLMEQLLSVVTLGIGWLIWSFVEWGKGTTPGHKVLNQYVVDEKTGETFGRGRMAIREIVIKGLLCGLLFVMTFSVFFIVDSLMVVRDDRRTIHDRISGSLVVQRQAERNLDTVHNVNRFGKVGLKVMIFGGSIFVVALIIISMLF